MTINKRALLAVFLAGTMLTSSALAGVYVRYNTIENTGEPIVMEIVSSETEEVLDTHTFLLDDSGHYVPSSVVYAHPQDELAEEVESIAVVDTSSPILLDPGATNDDVIISSGEAVADDTPIVGDDIPMVQIEEEEGILKDGWERIKSSLATTATKLEVLSQSLKAKVSTLHTPDATTAEDSAEETVLVIEDIQTEAEEAAQVVEPDQVK